MKKRITKALSLLLVMCSLLALIPALSTEAEATNYGIGTGTIDLPEPTTTVSNATQFVSYVNQFVGDNYTRGRCQMFVQECYLRCFGKSNAGGGCCATNAYTRYCPSANRGSWDIPIGAAVYFAGSTTKCSTCSNYAGHVGIYVGNNQIVHVWSGKIRKDNITVVTSSGYTYRGWGWQGNYQISQAPSYTVTYDPNGGKISSGSKTVTVTNGGTYGTQPVATRTLLAFDGWYTAKTGGTKITSSTTVKLTGNQTLYAHWTAIKTYTVTLNANGGTVLNTSGYSVSSTSKTVTKGGTYGALPTPTRKGYIFNGWYTAKSGGTKITASTTVSLTANQTLYAHWTASTLAFGSDFKGPTGTVTSNFGLRGTITSNCKITKVYAYVKNTQTGEIPSGFSYTKTGSMTSYNIQTGGLNNAFKFANLPKGTYIYYVQATDASGKTVTKSTTFTKT